MRSKKNSSLILLGVFTLGITQSYMVGALPESSADLANESNNEIKQQNIDVQQGTDDQNVDSKDENLLYINDDKKTKNISRVTKAMWGGAAGVAGISVPAAIFVKKTLDSKRNIDPEQEDNDDSERSKEVEKVLDDQKGKADNQDSKDEVESQDSKSISFLPFIVLGVVAIVVVGLIVYFVCKGKRKNISLQHKNTIDMFTNEESNNGNESSFGSESKNKVSVGESESKSEEKKLENELKSEPELVPELEDNLKKIYVKLKSISVDVEKVWTLGKLNEIFRDSSNSILETLLKKSDKELKTLWFCNENANTDNVDNMKKLFEKKYENVFKKLFGGDLESEKEGLFSLLIKNKLDNIFKLVYLFYILNENGFENINLTTEIAGILLKNKKFTACLALDTDFSGKIVNFTAAILTGNYKESQKSFKLNIENFKIKNSDECINFSYTFGNSPVDNLEALLSEFESLLEKYSNNYKFVGHSFLAEVVRKYNEWKPEQQQQEFSDENNNI